VDPLDGPWLAALPCEFVWATTWMGDACNVEPLLGRPKLPMAAWPDDPATEAADVRQSLHWKLRGLVALAGTRSFEWVDDELTDKDQACAAEHHSGVPRHGLTDADYLELDAWLRTA
jgi:hypothetical protein